MNVPKKITKLKGEIEKYLKEFCDKKDALDKEVSEICNVSCTPIDRMYVVEIQNICDTKDFIVEVRTDSDVYEYIYEDQNAIYSMLEVLSKRMKKEVEGDHYGQGILTFTV